MKLASLNSGRDGDLVVVSKDLKRYLPAGTIGVPWAPLAAPESAAAAAAMTTIPAVVVTLAS